MLRPCEEIPDVTQPGHTPSSLSDDEENGFNLLQFGATGLNTIDSRLRGVLPAPVSTPLGMMVGL